MSTNALKSSLTTTDFNHFATLIKNGTVENTLLQAGSFKASITSIISPNLIISRFNQRRGVFQKGFAAPGYVAFLIWEPGIPFNWHHHFLDRGVMPVVWGIEHISSIGNGFQGYPISVREDFLIEECKRRGLSHLTKSFASHPLYSIPDYKIQRVRDLVNELAESEQKPEAFTLEKHVMDLLLACFENSKVIRANDKCEELSEALDYIMANREKPISIKQLCIDKKISERTLRYQFQSRYKVSPKQFVQAVRLNLFLIELNKSDPNEPIYKVANRLGFWHIGQLAKDFKNLFGVLPREVRQRNSVTLE